MFLYIIKTTLRGILKDKASAIINFLNMFIGFTAFILLGIIVYNEMNWDSYQENFDRIYRVQTRQDDSEAVNYCTYSPSALRYRVMEDLPEVEEALIMRELQGQFFVAADGKQVYDNKGYYAENSIFNIFTYTFLQGNKNTALKDPYSIVLSKELADKIFPDGEALGKEVVIARRFVLRVDGVYQDLPHNSVMRPSYLVSMNTFELVSGRTDFMENWTAVDNDNFVLLKKGSDYLVVNDKIKNTFERIRNMEKTTPYLHPLSALHLTPNNQSQLLILLGTLGLVAILILVLSCVNFINLAIATSTTRNINIGIKKVVGFSKKAIALQFLTETLIITFSAAITGMIAANLLIPLANNIFGIHLETGVFDNPFFIPIVAGVALLTGLLAGIYPALVLASFNPAKIIKSALHSSQPGKLTLREVLVVMQYSISLFMLIGSLIIYNHVNYLSSKNMGFSKDEIIYADVTVSDPLQFESLRQRLLQHPEIVEATYSATIPFNGNIGGFVSWEDGLPDQFEMVSRNYTSYDFIPAYNLEIVEGRNFSREHQTDRDGCIINETALKAFGWKDPIGKQIDLWGRKYTVIGVVKDFHAFSVHNPIPNYILFLNDGILQGPGFISVRYTPGNEKTAKQLVSSELEAVIPNDPFEFRSFGYNIMADKAYIIWSSLKRIFIFFSVLTILIASIGLFGLIMFTAKRRTKEIGVRKILGSSVGGIFMQLSYEVIALLAFAVLIASPAAVMFHRNLPGAYKDGLHLWQFISAVMFVALFAFLTISYHVLKVARSNPSEALRYE